jgi:hypothetical protein
MREANVLLSRGMAMLLLGAMGYMTNSVALTLTLLLVCYVIAFGVALRVTRSIGNYIVVFLVFHMLYGLSGPINVVFGESLPRVFSGVEPATLHYLRQQLVTLAGFMGGVIFVRIITRHHPTFSNRVNVEARALARSAIVAAGLSSVMYALNLSRLGGIDAVFRGKANFQSDLGSLFLTLPYQFVADIAVAVMCVALMVAHGPVTWRSRLAFLVALAPGGLSHVILGQRGPILGWLIILAAAVSLTRPYIPTFRHAVIGLVAYLSLASLFLLRGAIPHMAHTGNFQDGLATAVRAERVLYALNPATNEFGSAFGNFSAFRQRPLLAYPQFGATYIEGLAVPVPGFMYPGDKPIQVSYRFRDAYIPEFARATRISGTGFGSVLEAYINFGEFGGLLVYTLVGAALALCEVWKVGLGLYGIVNYVALSQLAQSFHRSSFGLVFGTVVLIALASMAWYLMFAVFVRTRSLSEGHERSRASALSNGNDSAFSRIV